MNRGWRTADRDDEHAKVNVDAFVLEGADNSQRAGGGGNHEVGDIQAHAQDATQTDHGFLGQTGELFCQGGQDDEAGVTEDRDGNNKAGQAQNNVCALNADKLQNGDSHTLGSAAFFQKDTLDAAEADDDTNACHVPPKPPVTVLMATLNRLPPSLPVPTSR